MKDLGKALTQLTKLEDEIYKYFKYKQEWRVFPIEDSREYFWCIHGIFDSEITYSPNENFSDPDTLYSDEIRGDVYRKDDFTMIAVDTRVDGNVFCKIFDSKKERKPSQDVMEKW